MKILKTLNAILITGLLFFSCSKDDNNESRFKPTDSNSLLAYYEFNNNLDDSSTNNIDGTSTSPDYDSDRNNQSNSSYILNGTEARAIETSDFPLTSGSFSMSFWLKIDDSQFANEPNDHNRYILGTREICNVSQFFNVSYLHSLTDGRENRISVEIRNSSTGAFSVGTDDLPVDEWVHIAFTVDNDAKETNIYFNDELKNTSTWDNLSVDVSNTAPFVIGTNVCARVANSGSMRGANIDDVAIFSSVLTTEQISDLALN